MSPTWSGAIIYEWVETQNHYGLVSYASVDPAEAATGTPLYGSPTPILPDYSNLLAQWKTVSPSSVSLAEYQKSTAAITPLACPTSTADGWLVAGNVPLPTVGQSGAVTSTSASASATGKTGGAMAVRAGEGTGLGVAFLTALMGLCGWL